MASKVCLPECMNNFHHPQGTDFEIHQASTYTKGVISKLNHDKDKISLESFQARVCIRDFSTLTSRSKENKKCMIVGQNEQKFSRAGAPEATCGGGQLISK